MIKIINEKTKHAFVGFLIFTTIYLFHDFDEDKAIFATIFIVITLGIFNYFSKKEKFDPLSLASMAASASIGYLLVGYFII